jgi:hypothetical protein
MSTLAVAVAVAVNPHVSYSSQVLVEGAAILGVVIVDVDLIVDPGR